MEFIGDISIEPAIIDAFVIDDIPLYAIRTLHYIRRGVQGYKYHICCEYDGKYYARQIKTYVRDHFTIPDRQTSKWVKGYKCIKAMKDGSLTSLIRLDECIDDIIDDMKCIKILAKFIETQKYEFILK